MKKIAFWFSNGVEDFECWFKILILVLEDSSIRNSSSEKEEELASSSLQFELSTYFGLLRSLVRKFGGFAILFLKMKLFFYKNIEEKMTFGI